MEITTQSKQLLLVVSRIKYTHRITNHNLGNLRGVSKDPDLTTSSITDLCGLAIHNVDGSGIWTQTPTLFDPFIPWLFVYMSRLDKIQSYISLLATEIFFNSIHSEIEYDILATFHSCWLLKLSYKSFSNQVAQLDLCLEKNRKRARIQDHHKTLQYRLIWIGYPQSHIW